MTKKAVVPQEEGIRLSKRVMEIAACSRAQAERYIEGGFVRVGGAVVELPEHRVRGDKVELDAQASLLPQPPVTMLLHKPSGFEAFEQPSGPRAPSRVPHAAKLMTAEHHAPHDRSAQRVLRQHFAALQCVSPLETGASGLVVFTKDFTIKRKLMDDAARVEHELIVQVNGEVSEQAIEFLNREQQVNPRMSVLARVSVTHQPEPQEGQAHQVTTGLRFALKGCVPGLVQHLCERADLEVMSIKRIRLGRLSLGGLALGQWRYLAASHVERV